jgi:hypothetical protein
MDTKIIALLLAGVLVGVGIGVGAGYAAFHEDTPAVDETTYWFYIDLGEESSKYETQWISAKSDTPLGGFLAATAATYGEDCSIADTGWITSIGGVAGSWDASSFSGFSWLSWFWSSDDLKSYQAWRESPGFGNVIGTIFYVGFTFVKLSDDGWYEMMPDLNPNRITDWKGAGPFA